MWYYDEPLGVWKEEGEAHLIGKLLCRLRSVILVSGIAMRNLKQWNGAEPFASGMENNSPTEQYA
jgi:hypothetical protein